MGVVLHNLFEQIEILLEDYNKYIKMMEMMEIKLNSKI